MSQAQYSQSGNDNQQQAERPRKPASQGWAIVKQVLSGDTVVIMGQSGKGYAVAPTKMISLEHIMCPRAMRSRNTEDEAFGWEAKEFTRKLLIGQTVQFQCPAQDVREGNNIPDKGNIFIQGGRNVAQILLEQGWAKVMRRRDANGNMMAPDEYVRLEEAAKTAKIGRFKDVGDNYFKHIRQCNYDVEQTELTQIWDEYYKKKNLPVNINRVRSGSTFMCELVRQKDDKFHKSIMLKVFLAGVICPETLAPLPFRIRRWEERNGKLPKDKKAPMPTDKDPGEAWAREAQNYCEIRLLNRDVELQLVTKDINGNLFVNVILPKYPERNISTSLLTTGLGKIQTWSCNALPGNTQQMYKGAQAHAQANRFCQWRDNVPQQQTQAKYEARVVQVISGDTIMINNEQENKEERLTLASLRTPRMGSRYQDAEPWSEEAREYMRSKLIGRKVRIIKEYERAPMPNSNFKDPQVFVSVYRSDESLNTKMVEMGFADVIPHRQNDPRATDYAAMIQGLEDAKKKKRGRWGKDPENKIDYEDLTKRFGPPWKGSGKDPNENERRQVTVACKQFLDANKGKKISGLVEYVFHGGRVKVSLKSEKSIVIFLTGGIRTPRYNARSGEKEEFGEEGYRFARDKILQRNVTIIPENMDRGGNIIGQLLYNNNQQNLGEELLKRGLGKVNYYGTRDSIWGERLVAADEFAKKNKKNIYADYDPEEEKRERDRRQQERWGNRENRDNRGGNRDNSQGQGGGRGGRGARQERNELEGKSKEVFVTHVEDAATFYVNFLDAKFGQKITNEMGKIEATDNNIVEKVRNGGIYGGLFDGAYYRVRSVGKKGRNKKNTNPGGGYNFKFIDFGNEDILQMDDLVTLPKDLQNFPALAHQCQFAGLRSPLDSSEFFDECGEAAAEAIFNKKVTCRIIIQMRQILEVDLLDDDGQSIPLRLAKAGYLREPSKQGHLLKKKASEWIQEIDKAIATASRGRLVMYSRGAPAGSDDEDDDKPKGGRGRGGGRS